MINKGFGTVAIIASIAGIAVVGSVVFFNMQPKEDIMKEIAEEMMEEGKEMMEEGEAMMDEGEEMMEEIGSTKEVGNDVMVEEVEGAMESAN